MGARVAAPTVSEPLGLGAPRREGTGGQREAGRACRTWPGSLREGGGGPSPAAPQSRILHRALPAPRPLGPASPGVPPGPPARVDVGRGTARSSRHWLGSRLSRAAAVALRLGLRAAEEAGVR